MGQEYEQLIQLEIRMQRMEAMMQALLTRLDINPETLAPVETSRIEPVRQAVLAGNIINAIKIYRELYGVGLKQAKDAVEAIQREMRRG
jgi:ribosomal protein L7/L12